MLMSPVEDVHYVFLPHFYLIPDILPNCSSFCLQPIKSVYTGEREREIYRKRFIRSFMSEVVVVCNWMLIPVPLCP